MKSKFFFLLIVLALSSVIACGNNNQAQDRKKGDKDKQAEAVPVEVTSPARATMEATLNLTATAYSEERVPIYSEATGIVEGPPLEEGTPVRKGQVLARLKRQELDLALQLAESTFSKAQADFTRSQALYRDHLVSQDTYDQVQYALDQARIARNQARVELAKATITAPIDGVVAERLIRRGDLVKPQQQIFTLVNLDTIKANLYVPEKNLREVKVGSVVRVRSDVFPGELFEGGVERIAPVADPSTGTFKVTVTLPNPGTRLRPGMFLSTSVVVETRPEAMVIPKKSIVYDSEATMVFVVKGDKAKKVPVKTGLTDLMNVEVVNGVAPDDQVVTVGQSGLKDGARVRILPSTGGGSDMALGL